MNIINRYQLWGTEWEGLMSSYEGNRCNTDEGPDDYFFEFAIHLSFLFSEDQ